MATTTLEVTTENTPDTRDHYHCALASSLRYSAYSLKARLDDGSLQARLPLLLVSSRLFGRFLVSLPYVNSAGVMADNDEAASKLIDAAVALADELDVDHLQLRHEKEIDHPKLTDSIRSKVLMRLSLPETTDELWKSFKPKVRNQVRKGEKCNLDVHWGNQDRLDDFYTVFARNMRDLGTPVYPKRLFESILAAFGDDAELCVVHKAGRPIAGALLVHQSGRTEVPSASSLRAFNSTNANMLMYWHLLKRAVERGQKEFDFGRSTEGSNTYRFKKQWGAQPHPSVWQYYVRRGSVGDTRPDSPKYRLAIRVWQKMPVWLANRIGPPIVRGIP